MTNNGIWIMYLRKSRQDDPNESIEEVLEKHKRQLQDFAETKLGGRIPQDRIFMEIGSGESIADRTEIKKVLAMLENPAVIGCVVLEPSRLSRGDLSDCAKIIDSFRYSRSLVATPYMTYDLNHKMERKFFQDELLRGNEYLEYVKGILQRGREQSVKSNGAFLGSVPPFGYKKIKVGKIPTLEIVEDEAEIVRLIFQWYTKDGYSLGKISRELNAMGVKSKHGKRWERATIQQMVRNPHYAGYVIFNRRKRTLTLESGQVVTKRVVQQNDDVIMVEGKHQPIISRETWEVAKNLGTKNPPVKHSQELTTPLAGILYCGKCGYAMRIRHYKNRNPRVSCKDKPPCYKSVKHSAVVDAVLFALEQSELPALELRLQNNDGNAIEIQRRQIDRLEKQMEEYRAQEDRQFELLETNPNYSQEVFNRRHAELRQKMDECQSALYHAKSTLPEAVDYSERIGKMKSAIDILKDDKATPAEKNKILKEIVEKIVFTGRPSVGRNVRTIGDDPFELDITLKL